MAELTIGQIRNTDFLKLYEKLILNEDLAANEIQNLYKLALIFINRGNDIVQRFGYKILLKTSLYEKSYIPLYDISINFGYYPLTKILENIIASDEDSFIQLLLSSFLENYRSDDIYFTEQQKQLVEGYKDDNNATVAVVAPTSYGKSELILNTLKNNPDENICIIVPTKALLAQTKRRIINANQCINSRRVVTHPDMHIASEKKIIGILTQERLLRLLEKHKDLQFHSVVIDEAHNLFSDDHRNRLLASSIAIMNKRNPVTYFKFLSPFLIDSKSLLVKSCGFEINEKKITEFLKINNFYYIDFINPAPLSYYDQFLNNSISVENSMNSSDLEFIRDKASNKNIIYFNSPPKLELFAKNIQHAEVTSVPEQVLKACREIGSYLHADYSLLDCLKRGVVYHHGSVPDIVKLYIENLYTQEPFLKFMVCSSTLLEGVNIPAEKLFIMDHRKGRRKLSPSQFKNLCGRICRFNEIFNHENINLKLLEPEIYLIKSDYMRADANILDFLKDSVKEDKKLKDKTENVLLTETPITAINKAELAKEEEFLDNFEEDMNISEKSRKASTEVGKACFKNSLKEIDIIKSENSLQAKINDIKGKSFQAKSEKEVIELISNVFLEYVLQNDNNDNLLRLKELKTQNFYSMFLSWIMRNAPFNELIGHFVSYWNRLKNDITKDPFVYVGKWGDETRDGYLPLWVNIRDKTDKELVNLAILRIKEEQDFIDNTIVKFIEILNDLDLIEENIYKQIKYGTDNDSLILMIKNGFSSSLAKLLLSKYSEFLELNFTENFVTAEKGIIDAMRANSENDIYIFETSFNIKG
ncbi:MAG: DEAD/DEAH box helicase [Gudongella sp.]|jgi:hypothetical protein|nr:DEAD/DEAH box helicase [Gudongella sp.]